MTDVWGDRLSACPGGLLSLVMGWREKDPLTPVWHLSSAQYPESCRGLLMVWNLTPLSYCLHSTPVISTLQNNSLGCAKEAAIVKQRAEKKQNLSYYFIIIHCVIHNPMRSIKEIASRASAFILSCGIISNRLFPCEHVLFCRSESERDGWSHASVCN